MNCPHCSTSESQGCLEAPDWVKTDSGKAWAIRCLNCGWYGFHPEIYFDYTQPRKRKQEAKQAAKYLRHEPTVFRQLRQAIDLSKYDFA